PVENSASRLTQRLNPDNLQNLARLPIKPVKTRAGKTGILLSAVANGREAGGPGSLTLVTERICSLYYLEKSRTPMKTIKQEEPIIRNRFVECPNCKTRNMKIKKIVHVGRCRKCHDSYKVV